MCHVLNVILVNAPFTRVTQSSLAQMSLFVIVSMTNECVISECCLQHELGLFC